MASKCFLFIDRIQFFPSFFTYYPIFLSFFHCFFLIFFPHSLYFFPPGGGVKIENINPYNKEIPGGATCRKIYLKLDKTSSKNT